MHYFDSTPTYLFRSIMIDLHDSLYWSYLKIVVISMTDDLDTATLMAAHFHSCTGGLFWGAVVTPLLLPLQLAGTFSLLGCLISLWHIAAHLRHYYKCVGLSRLLPLNFLSLCRVDLFDDRSM